MRTPLCVVWGDSLVKLETDSSVSVTFTSGDPHFPKEIRASPRCNNLRNKRENKETVN